MKIKRGIAFVLLVSALVQGTGCGGASKAATNVTAAAAATNGGVVRAEASKAVRETSSWWAGLGTTAEAASLETSGVIHVSPPPPSEPLQLDESLMRSGQRYMPGRTREMRPGVSHEASLAVESAQAEQRAEEPRSPIAPAANAIEVSGAATTRDIGSVATPGPVPSGAGVRGGALQADPSRSAAPVAPLTPAQRAAQEAAQKRKDVPVRSAE